MSFELVLHALASAACAAAALAVALRDRRSFIQRAFAFGMVVLAIEAALSAGASLAATPAARILAERWRAVATALIPGSWLLFSVAFARSEPRAFIRRWRVVLAVAFALPLLLATVFAPALYIGISEPIGNRWLLPLGWAGYAFHLVVLAGAVLTIANLERTLRASTGSMRWFLKYMVLGVTALFAVRIYTSSQALLFRFADTDMHVLESAALLVGVALIGASLLRSRLRDADVYVSDSVLYNSVTVLFVGVYLLAVGVLAKAVAWFGGVQVLPLVTFVVFLALIGLTILLLSDRLRHRVRAFVSRNFRRPQYDYRKEWTAFTRATSSLVEVKTLCTAVANRVSETLRVPSVSVWLLDEGDAPAPVTLGGSTLYSEREAGAWAQQHGTAVAALLRDTPGPVDLHEAARNPAAHLSPTTDTRYGVALSAGGEELGFMVLGSRPDIGPLTVEDHDLLRTIADQAASGILSLRLSERLLKAKEMEAFQSLSAFFVHDLKNLASKLSLTLQNLPAHYDDPEFRRDLLATITRSVAKINDMCTRLSPLSRTLELQRTPSDLASVVAAAMAGLDGNLRAQVEHDLRPTPPVSIDPEQIQKVVLNLMLNANDAVRDGGQIRVATGHAGRWAYIAVTDDGCGMSPEFLARSLFKPFRTTKGQGLGIGLYHSKKIVEAHQGRIEVESAEGKGTTMRVLLPA